MLDKCTSVERITLKSQGVVFKGFYWGFSLILRMQAVSRE